MLKKIREILKILDFLFFLNLIFLFYKIILEKADTLIILSLNYRVIILKVPFLSSFTSFIYDNIKFFFIFFLKQ